jgi:hypothetical protein
MDEAAVIAEYERIFGTGGEDIFGPRSEEAIVAAERELGLTFPRTLRIFFRRLGAAFGVGGVTLYGLPDTRDTDEEMPQFLNVIDQTDTIRQSYYGAPPRPHEWINLGSDGGGLFFYIDTSRKNADGDSPVLIEGPGVPLQPIGENFLEFVRRLCDDPDPFADLVDERGRRIREVRAEARARRAVEEPAELTRAGSKVRQVHWIEIEPDPCPSDLPRMARHYAIDPAARDVFVHAETAGLDLEQQVDAMAIGAAFFGDPSGRTDRGTPFVSIDYLIQNHADMPDAWIMPRLKEVVLEAYDRSPE